MTRGTLNCYLDGRPFQRTISNSTDGLSSTLMHDVFISIYNTLNGEQGNSLGIVRRALNFGSTSTTQNNMSIFPASGSGGFTNPGTGMTRWDESSPAGENAWAAFEFTNASPKFWMLLQFSAYTPNNTQRFGVSQGDGVTQLIQFYTSSNVHAASTRDNSVGVIFSFNEDGTSPWLGSTNNDGTDTRPTAPFSSGSCIFPRGNDLGGAFYYNNRNCFMPLVHEASLLWTGNSILQNCQQYDALDSIYHILLDQEQFIFLLDNGPIGRLSSFFYFGKFTPSDTSNTSPYICLMRNSIYDDSASTIWMRHPRYVYGSIIPNGADGSSGGSNNYMRPDSNIELGTTDYRLLINGGVYNDMTGHASACSLDMPSHIYKTSISGSMLMNNDLFWGSNTIRHEVAKPIVYCNDTPFVNYSRIGVIEYFKMASGMRNATYFSDGNEIALGNPNFSNNKIIVPWSPTIDYGNVGNRYGEVW